MAIWQIEMDTRDIIQYRKQLNSRGFFSSNYFSSNGFNLTKMRKLARSGELDAVKCVMGQVVRWYYAEEQAELARLRGQVG